MTKSMDYKKATLSDVALLAGVSKSAAAAVLVNKKSTARVSPETRDRVLLSARELNYRPHAIASSLRRQSTNTIGYYTGYVTVDLRVPFHNHVLNGVRQACDDNRKHLLLQGTFADSPIEQVYDDLTDGKIDGVVLHLHDGHPLVPFLRQDRIPSISIAEKLSAIPSVTIDDEHGSRMLAAYLHAKGHKRILYRFQIPEGASTSSCRLPVFLKMASEYGMEVIHNLHPGELGTVSQEEERCLRGIEGHRPTAVVCWNDFIAHQFMRYCRKSGIDVPGDFAVAGFDGYTPYPTFEAAPAYDLTTIRIPWEHVGTLAATLLLDKIAGNEIADETVVPVQMVEGETA